MVIKEALNNLVKHARASEVGLRLRWENSRLLISIEDNGIGLSAPDTRASGNGLQNMAKRMEGLGGTFDLQTEPGQGTRIRLDVPIQPEPGV